MRFSLRLCWSPRVCAVVLATILNSPFTHLQADEPATGISPEQAIPAGVSPDVERIASAEQSQYSGTAAPAPAAANLPPPKPAPPIAPWKPLYFDNDFNYKKKPDHKHLLGEELKDMPLEFLDGMEFFDGSTLSYGGEVRYRFMNEDNRIRPLNPGGKPGRSTYDLWRWRQYLDFKVRDEFRIYVEMLDASIFNEELPVTAIDANRWNIQNAFFDVKIGERDGKPIYFRTGRQELLYGAPSAMSPGQQVVSPLDWANTRRNFEGFRLISKGTTWDFDAFATRPVNTAFPTGPLGGRPVATSVNHFDNARDRADSTRWFSGLYSVYRGIENQTIEPYYVWLATDAGHDQPGWADGNRHTTGLRWTTTKPIKDECGQAWFVFGSDIEGAYQFGNDNRERVSAGFFTSKIGGTFAQASWTPQVQFIYYWGSGDRKAGDGKNNTYDVLAPLGHAYWGIIDNLAGQNLNDYAIQVTAKPDPKLTLLSAIHWFNLDRNTDKLYNVAGAPQGVVGSGSNVGQELDLIGTYAFNPNFDVQLGYSWFWYGTHITAPGSGLNRQDASQLYLQTSLRY